MSAMRASGSAFPEGGRRLVVYVVYDRRGGVDEYVVHALAGLREHAARILVVVNGKLTPEGRARLEPVSDEVLVRDNVGFDIWAHKEALEHVGAGLSEFDEVVLTNDTWFGPVRPFGAVFERMDALEIDFWGMTDHSAEDWHMFTGSAGVPHHPQSFWIAVRRSMFTSERWARYWQDLPEMPGYRDAVLGHELVFTSVFRDAGFVDGVAFRSEDYGSANASLLAPVALMEDGCPLLKRRVFFHSPPFLDRHAVIGRWALEAAAAGGYPTELALSNLARNVAPKVLNADAGLMDVLGPDDAPYDPAEPLRVVVVAHIFYDEMTPEILERADTLPVPYDFVVTTPDPTRAERIREHIARLPGERGDVSVRVVESNDGRDQSAFLVGCRDVLSSGRYDVVVKLHSKKTPQDGYNVGTHFREQQFLNLLPDRDHSSRVLGLFQREKGLGLAFPPMIHIGYPTLGRAWWANKPGFERLADEMGIRVPLDDVSPLAPYGSMFFARPEALRLLVDREWRYSDFGGADAYQDGGLAHILERMPSYAAGELGFHSRTIVAPDYAAVSHTALDFKLDEMSATIPGYAHEKIDRLRTVGYVGTGSGADFLRMYMRLNHMGVVHRLRRVMDPLRRPGRWIRAMVDVGRRSRR
ncbi:rhamnan synthesis F family protein [Microbacterium enclense]|uniref:rhamnan synthesis F family protein n=1 Tax=Microbacterium enclense TaxID=993073 RepID=UPI0021A92765|nr:rhamnan synthesis F family protein [Microbacterium enclense]MCT2084702.1 rhamnan synthesis F family protein [Microbacterium enclense]